MAGKTNARWIRVSMEDTGGVARDVSASVSSISGVGLVHDQADVTGYSDGWHNVTLGHPTGVVTLSGPVDNTAAVGSHIVFSALNGYQANARELIVDIGIKAAPTNPDPRWTGDYYCSQYTINDDATYDAELVPAGATVGAWTTIP